MKEIQVRNNNGRCLIRFRYLDKAFNITQGSYDNRAERAKAEALAKRIYSDILSGKFDPTLDSYKPPVGISREQAKKSMHKALEAQKVVAKGFSGLWEQFLEAQDLTPRQSNQHWKSVTALLRNYGKPVSLDEIPEFISWMGDRLSAPSFNTYLSYLKRCGGWAVQQGIIAKNPFAEIKNKRNGSQPKPQPFTKKEIQAIISAFESSEYYSPYADFVKFLFATGVRTSEAIGLRWKHIKFDREEIEIYEVLARGDKGETSGSKRVRKGTKTENSRVLPCTGKLKEMLWARRQANLNAKPDDLVFPSPTGKPIDDHNFRNRAWVKTLEQCGVEYRKPYTIRHSLISHMIAEGVPLTGVAYIAGHRDTTMVIRTYAHMIDRPELPKLL